MGLQIPALTDRCCRADGVEFEKRRPFGVQLCGGGSYGSMGQGRPALAGCSSLSSICSPGTPKHLHIVQVLEHRRRISLDISTGVFEVAYQVMQHHTSPRPAVRLAA